MKSKPYTLTLADAWAIFRHTGSEDALRSIPEGRAALLEMALRRRTIPLELRRTPKLMGMRASEAVSRIAIDILTK